LPSSTKMSSEGRSNLISVRNTTMIGSARSTKMYDRVHNKYRKNIIRK